MAITKHADPAPKLTIQNKYPDFPTLPTLTDAENSLIDKWMTDMQQVMSRQFDQLAAAIDKKQNAP